MDKSLVETEEFCTEMAESYGEIAQSLDEEGHEVSAQVYWRLCHLWDELSKAYRRRE